MLIFMIAEMICTNKTYTVDDLVARLIAERNLESFLMVLFYVLVHVYLYDYTRLLRSLRLSDSRRDIALSHCCEHAALRDQSEADSEIVFFFLVVITLWEIGRLGHSFLYTNSFFWKWVGADIHSNRER